MRTYLPIFSDPHIFQRLAERDYEVLLELPATEYEYERIGLDRLLTIIQDMRKCSINPPASVLDLGCSTGLFTWGLSELGYFVTGIDNSIATDVHPVYPSRVLDLANRQRLNNRALFRDTEIADFIINTTDIYDVCLLLSVVHQWFAGYALSGKGAKSHDEIITVLAKLAQRVRRCIYFEGPENEPIIPNSSIKLPDWFISAGLASAMTPLSQSVSTFGQLRTMYRLDIIPNGVVEYVTSH
jgi:SAM-dependent methyltransferase